MSRIFIDDRVASASPCAGFRSRLSGSYHHSKSVSSGLHGQCMEREQNSTYANAAFSYQRQKNLSPSHQESKRAGRESRDSVHLVWFPESKSSHPCRDLRYLYAQFTSNLRRAACRFYSFRAVLFSNHAETSQGSIAVTCNRSIIGNAGGICIAGQNTVLYDASCTQPSRHSAQESHQSLRMATHRYPLLATTPGQISPMPKIDHLVT